MNNDKAPKNYEEALKFLFEQLPMFSKQGATALNPSLDKIQQLCKVMGHPEQQIKTIHIAGTNGKGSTSHIISAVFQQSGYKTGLYTSPHLVDLRERIRINGALIDEKIVLNFIQENWHAIRSIAPSYFELNVAMAFWCFAQEKVDIAVIETGLGGRWDSTNVIQPELSVITNISLDHTHILGNTIAAIAGEKAGIIKPETPVVIGIQQRETAQVFSRSAIANRASLVYADSMFSGVVIDQKDDHQIIKLIDKQLNKIETIETDLLGGFQVENICTARAAINVLHHLGWNKLSDQHFIDALQSVKKLTGLRGRWDILRDNPTIIADVGHNPSGLTVIKEQLKQSKYQNRKLHIVIGFVADKDVDEALSLLPQNGAFYFCQAQIPRALAHQILYDKAKILGLSGTSFATVPEAVSAAQINCSIEDIILIIGSFFIVGEAISFLEQSHSNH